MKAALEQFANALQQKFSATIKGEPEDQLRAPFEQLLQAAGAHAGFDVQAIGETRLQQGGGRPDFGVASGKLLCGYAELKAPGKGADTAIYSGHDKNQWERFANLPNMLYSDGREFALYRRGERQRFMRLARDPLAMGAAAVADGDARQFEALLRDYLAWEPIVPGSSKQLAEYLAPITRILRDDVRDALRNRTPGVVDAARDWRRYLFPGADDVSRVSGQPRRHRQSRSPRRCAADQTLCIPLF